MEAENPDVSCPVCSATASFAYAHPSTAIYRCLSCGHAFSHLESMQEFEEYGEDYYQEAHRNWFENPNIPLFKWISEHLGANAESVIDVGCGKGDLLRYLQKDGIVRRLVGIDLSEPRDDPGIEYIRGDILTTRIEEKFDVVVSLAVIEHVPDVQAFAQRLYGLCKPGGRVSVMTLNESGMLYRLGRLGNKLGVSIAFDRLYSAHHLHHFTPNSLQQLLTQAGFNIIDVHHHNAPIQAIDVPVSSPVKAAILKLGVAAAFAGGYLIKNAYLQTVLAEVPAQK